MLHRRVLGVGIVVVHVVLGVVVLVDDLGLHGGPGVRRGGRQVDAALVLVLAPVDPVLGVGGRGSGDGEDVVVRVQGVQVWKLIDVLSSV